MNLTQEELRRAFGDGEYPPILTVEQAAELAQVSVKTVYDWSSRGLLQECAVRRGKRLRLWRDKFVAFLFEEADDANKK